jgi:hypothetical protein
MGNLLFAIRTSSEEILWPFVAQRRPVSYPLIGVANLLRDAGLVCSDRVANLLRNTGHFGPKYAAVALEGKILTVIKEELKSGKYNLLKTHLGREVFTRAEKHRLTEDIPERKAAKQTWQERIKEYGFYPRKDKEE